MRLAILGAGGHAKVIADAALAAGWSSITFFDDAFPQKQTASHWHIVGKTEALLAQHTDFDGVIVGIGNNFVRLKNHLYLRSLGAKLVTIVHPAAAVSPFARIGIGSLVLATAVINVDACIGEACVINTGAVVEHDCQLGDAVHISPKGAIGGGAVLGDRTWVGIGACIRHAVKIAPDVVIGAGAAVVADVSVAATVIGVPAKPLQIKKC